MNETKQTQMEESAPRVARFTLPPVDAIRFACNTLALFPWAESDLAADILPSFLVAALGGVKEYGTGKPISLYVTGGQGRARAALYACVRDMLADSPAVVSVPAGTDSAGIAAAVRACPAARLMILEDAAPVRSALRYIAMNAGGVAVLAFAQGTFADSEGCHDEGAIELRLRDYVDATEDSTLEEFRRFNAMNVCCMNAARCATEALRQAEAASGGRPDLTAAAVLDMLTKARDIIDAALTAESAVPEGISAALASMVTAETARKIANVKQTAGMASSYVVYPENMLATLFGCNPQSSGALRFSALGVAYAKSMNSARKDSRRR